MMSYCFFLFCENNVTPRPRPNVLQSIDFDVGGPIMPDWEVCSAREISLEGGTEQ